MHVLLLGYRPALKKNLNFVFLFIRKGYKVFSPLRCENDLFKKLFIVLLNKLIKLKTL